MKDGLSLMCIGGVVMGRGVEHRCVYLVMTRYFMERSTQHGLWVLNRGKYHAKKHVSLVVQIASGCYYS